MVKKSFLIIISLLFLISLIVLISLSSNLFALTITLNESNGGNIGDAGVSQADPDFNYDVDTTFIVKTYTNDNMRGFLKWNLSVVPSGYTITNANLSIYLLFSPTSSRTLNVYNTTANWSESTLTWNNQPSLDKLQDSVVGGIIDDVWISWNVTNATNSAYQSGKNLSLAIRDNSEGSATEYEHDFKSKEANVSHRPQLIITYLDLTPPSFSNNQTNASSTTYNGTTVQINLTITDSVGLDFYTLSRNDSIGYTLCYQETANVSTSCGGLSSGTYNCDGDWTSGYPCSNSYDGDWDTYATPSNVTIPGELFFNYTKPLNALNSSLLQIQDGGAIPVVRNLSLDKCWSQNPLQFHAAAKVMDTVNWSCWNGTEWYVLLNADISNIFEEAMWWNISSNIWANESFVDAGDSASLTMVWNYSIINFSSTGGTMGWQVWANDTAGNVNVSDIYTFSIIETIPPSFSSNQTNASSTTYNGTDVQINLTISDDTAVDFYTLTHNDTSDGTWANESFTDAGDTSPITMIWNYSITHFPTTGGTMGWRVWANDTAGNVNVSNIYTFAVAADVTAPIITIIAPSNNSNFSTSSVTFNASINEQASWCGLSINNNINQTMTLNSSLTGANYTNSSIADGKYYFRVSCNDTANNYGQSSAYNFTVDTTPPTISVTMKSPPGGATYTNNTWTNNNIQITMTTADSGVGVNTLSYPVYCTDTINTCTPSTYISSGVTVSTEGTSYIRYSSTDRIGNVKPTEFMVLKIDTTIPSFSNNQTNASSTTYNGTTVQINLTITDSVGLDFYRLSHNDTSDGVWTNESLVDTSGTSVTAIFNYSITNFPTTGGTMGWQVWANDTTGNTNVSDIYTFTVADSTPPPINFTSPTPSNATTQSATNVEINVSITESDLGEVKFNWNGTNYTMYNDSLVLMMNFDNRSSLEEDNTKVVDLSKYGNNGTHTGDSFINLSGGRYEGGLQVDGAGDYVTVGDKASLDMGTNNFSISVWIKGENVYTSSIFNVLSKGTNNADGGYDLGVTSSDFYARIEQPGQAVVQTYTPVDPFLTGTWQHIAVVYDRSDKVYIYLNGTEVSYTAQPDISGVGNIDTAYAFVIASDYDGGSDFNGSIDEVRIYNQTLSATEVYELYVSNLYKFNQTQWYLYVNQSKNSTTGLSDGVYTYSASAKDISSNENRTETRTITIDTVQPSFSNNQTNANSTTYNGTTVQINLTISDNTAVNFYTLTHNDTSDGTWANESFTDAGDSASLTMVWNYSITNFPTTGGTMGWQIWANDSANNVNVSNIYTFNVVSQNTAPTLAVQNTFINWSAGHKFNVTAGVTDLDGATDITSTNITVSSGNCNNIVNSSSGDNFNSTWNCSGTALASTNIQIGFTDGDDEYISSDLSTNVYPNQAPATPTNLGAEATRTTGQTITATDCTTTDADGDSMQNYFEFYNVNDTSTVQAYSTTTTYVLQATDNHNQIRTRCKVDDGYVNTTEDEVFTTILDTLPTTPTDLSVEPTRTTGQTITALCTDSTDADGDTITYQYEFYNVNDTSTVQAYSTTTTYVLQATDNHNQIRTRCKSITDYGEGGEDTEFTDVLNTAPNQPSISYPTDGKNYSDIPYINYTTTDADSDALTYTLYINNTINVTGISSNVTQWNASDGYYNLTVTASDGSFSSDNSSVVRFRLDTIAPSWSNNETNASLMKINGNATFNITVSDYGSGLSYYIFSWNGTGSWDNLTNGSIFGNSVKLVINKSTNLSYGNTMGYRWYANDSLNQWNNSELRTFSVVNTPITFSNAVNGSVNFRRYENFTANITIDDADGQLESYIFSTNNSGSWNNDSLVSISGGTYYANSSKNISLAQGNYVCWEYYANDSADSIQNSDEYCFSIANTAPTAPTISYPAGRNYTDIPYINYSSTDADADSITYQVYINGSLNITTTTNVTDWNASDGYYNLTVTANDGIDSSANSSAVNFRLDTTIPSFSNNQTNVSSTSPRYNEIIQINLTITDNGAGLDGYFFAHNDTSTMTNGSYRDISGSSYVVIENISIDTLTRDNVLGWQVWVNDSVNNVNVSGIYTLVIRNTPPVTPSVTSPTDGETSNSINIEFNSTDIDGDAISYAIYINNTMNITTTTNITDWNASDGYYNLTITADDSADYSSNSSVIHFTLDTTAPTVSIIYPTNALNISSNSIDLNGSASDNINKSSLTYYWVINGTTNSTSVDSNSTFNASDGYYNLTLKVSDGLQNGSDTAYFRLDTISPSINYAGGTENNNTYFNRDWIYINVTVIENNFKNITFYLYNSTSVMNITNYITQDFDINFTSLNPNEYYFYNVTIRDVVELENSTSTRKITLDNIYPSISFNSNTDANDTWKQVNHIFINVTAYDLNNNTVGMEFNGVNESFADANGNLSWENKTGLTTGSYLFYAWMNDSAGNFNSTGIYNVSIDLENPSLTLLSPQSITYGTNVSLGLNYTVSDTYLLSCWYSLDSENNITLSNCQNLTFNVSVNTHTLNLFVNDSSGRISTQSVTFSVDIDAPSITLDYPSNNEKITYNLNIPFNYTPTDANLDTCEFWINSTNIWHRNQSNTSSVSSGNINTFYLNLTDGNIIWNIWCNDTTAKSSWGSLFNYTLNIDTTIPSFTDNMTNASSTTPKINDILQLNITVTDNSDISMIALATNQSGTLINVSNQTFSGTSDTSITAIFNLTITMTRGLMQWQIWANDSYGNSNISEQFIVEIINTAPNQPSISYPVDGKNYSDIPYINYTTTDADSDALTYTLYINNTINVTGISSNVTQWNASDGYYNLTVTANDGIDSSANSSVVNFRLDTTIPSFSNNQTNVSSTSPRYNEIIQINLTITDNGIGLDGYFFAHNDTGSFVNGSYRDISGGSHTAIENITISTLKRGGVLGWQIWANDTLNQINVSQTYTLEIKNTVPQQPIISYPSDGKNYSDIPYINYTTTDADSDALTYTLYINNTINVTGISSNVTQWNASDGYYNLTVTASDGIDSSTNSTAVNFRLDTTIPSFSNNQTNASSTSPRYNEIIQINLTITDNGTGLDGYFFAHNDTSTMTNGSYRDISGGSHTSIENITISTLKRGGVLGWQIWANDTLNQINVSQTYTLEIKNTAPIQPSISYPVDGKNYSDIPYINYTTTDTDSDALTYTLYINNTINVTGISSNVTQWNASDGYYNLTVTASDGIDSSANSTAVNFRLDTIYPSIEFAGGTPLNNTNSTTTSIFINVSASDANFNSITFALYNESDAVNITTYTTLIENITFTGLSDAVYSFNVTINDSIGHINFTETRIRRLDDTIPSLSILHPLAQNYAYNDSITLNYTVTDNLIGVKECWYYIYRGVTEIISTTILSNCQNTTFSVPGGDDYDYDLTLFAKDYLENTQSASVTFGVRQVSPSIVLNNPTDDYYFNTLNNLRLNFTATDNDGIDTCKLYGNWSGTWQVNQTLTSITSGTQTNFNRTNVSIDEGTYIWNTWCNDTLNNSGFALNNYTFYTDTIKPSVNLTSPTATTYTSLSITLSHNETDFALDRCQYTYTISGATTSNTTVTCNSAQTLALSAYGTYDFNYYVIDKANNINLTNVTFITSQPSTPPSDGGGGKPSTELIGTEVTEPVILKVTREAQCGDNICDESLGETPWDCPRDCIKKVFDFNEIFCLPLGKCGNWEEAWFINIIIVVVVLFLTYFTILRKPGRLR